MIEVDVSGVVEAPLEDVWAFMTDLGTMRLRDPSVISVEWTPPLRAGSIAFLAVRQIKTMRMRYEVMEMVPRRLFRVRSAAMGTQIQGTWQFEKVEEGATRLSVSVEIAIGGLLRPISPFLSYLAKRGAKTEFKRIKGVVEGRRSLGAENRG